MTRTPQTALTNEVSLHKTVTTGISLLAGILLLAGCGGQTDQSAQDADTGTNTPTSTSNASGVDLPERTAPAKSLPLDDPCAIITERHARDLGVHLVPFADPSADHTACSYRKGEPYSDSGWRISVIPDYRKTISEVMREQPGGSSTKIAGYPAYTAEMIEGVGCHIAVDVAEEGFLYLMGGFRMPQDHPEACPFFSKFAKTAIENLPNA